MTSVVLSPAKVALKDWYAVYRGARLTVDPACRARIRQGAEAVERIVAKGEPVYGVNTGFGKLASVRIATADLESLQRNIVLSHAAGVGAPPRPSRRRPPSMVSRRSRSKSRGRGRGAKVRSPRFRLRDY